MARAFPTTDRGAWNPRSGRRGRPGRRPAVRQALSALLDSLGTTQAEVGQTLRASGVAGTRADPRDCAVARYLGAIVGADPALTGVSVGRSMLWVTRRGWRPALRVPLPPAVRRFVVAYDAGAHPELERSAGAGASLRGPLGPGARS